MIIGRVAVFLAVLMMGMMAVNVCYLVIKNAIKPYLMIKSMPIEMKKIMGVTENGVGVIDVVGRVGGEK